VRSGSILEFVGNTSLVELSKINQNPNVRLWAKLEMLNPSGSVKDRIVKYIIEDAEKRGLLREGGTIVENTSGNTGAAVAMFSAIKGYKAILTMPDKVSIEKQNALKAFGATVVVTPTDALPDSPEHYVNTARRIAAETKNSFMLDQYDNPLNAEAHYKSTGPEIWEQTGGNVDIFVASGSTGGTITGVSRFLKEKNPRLISVLPDPIGSIYYQYFKTKEIVKGAKCSYLVEGIGEDHLAKVMDFSMVDEMLQFGDKEAFAMSRRLAKEEGLLVGGSSGANVWASLQIAKNITKPTNIVTMLPDGGIKYLSKIFNDSWLREHDLLDNS